MRTPNEMGNEVVLSSCIWFERLRVTPGIKRVWEAQAFTISVPQASEPIARN
jgi:hypothetical protein